MRRDEETSDEGRGVHARESRSDAMQFNSDSIAESAVRAMAAEERQLLDAVFTPPQSSWA